MKNNMNQLKEENKKQAERSSICSCVVGSYTFVEIFSQESKKTYA